MENGQIVFKKKIIEFPVAMRPGIFFDTRAIYSAVSLTRNNSFVIILIEIDFQFLLYFMQSNTATKFLPIFSDEKKVEVSLTDDQAVIRLSTWTDDIGWCGQKTLSLDADMLDDLHRVITAARLKLNRRKAESEDNVTGSTVLQFPGFK